MLSERLREGDLPDDGALGDFEAAAILFGVAVREGAEFLVIVAGLDEDLAHCVVG